MRWEVLIELGNDPTVLSSAISVAPRAEWVNVLRVRNVEHRIADPELADD